MRGFGPAALGVVINVAISGMLVGEEPSFLAPLCGVFAAVSALGLLLAMAGSKRLGGGLVIAGSLFFVPIGLIGAFGGRQLLDAGRAEALEREYVS